MAQKKTSKNGNNICTITLTAYNNNQNNNNFNPFNNNSQLNITQQIKLINSFQNMENNNQNFSFNFFNEDNNFLNLSKDSLFSFQSKQFLKFEFGRTRKKKRKND